jgi:ParB-like chromosome segregation protein Spo0J
LEHKNELLLNIEWLDRTKVYPYARNSRQNEATAQVVARSIEQYGWQQPLVIDDDNIIVVGHSRWTAAGILGHKQVPVVRFTGTPEEAKEYRIADNRIQETSKWDFDILKSELADLDLDTGFSDEEIYKILSSESLTISAEPTVFEVVIELTDELEQQVLYNQLDEEGEECRLLSI